jgi:hypothetical protein
MRPGRHPLLALVLLTPIGCRQDPAPAPDPKTLYPDACDPIVPSECGFPFPSDIWRVADFTAPTGHRLEVPDGLIPTSASGGVTHLAIMRRNDGFSPGSTLITHLPGATTSGLPDPLHIDASLAPDSPTVLLEAETGARVAHWAELDVRSDPDPTPGDTAAHPRAFLIQPAARLKDGTRYIVAIRHVLGADGSPLAASDAFAALRDGRPFAHASIEARRDLYRDIFDRLGRASVAKSELQTAWSFTTSSQVNKSGGVLFMRDRALAALGPNAAPSYRIVDVKDDVDEHIARRIEGRITVPMYLDKTDPGGLMTIDPVTLLPVQQGTAEFPFLVQIPRSVTSTGAGPAPILHFGHGLFGNYMSSDDPRLRTAADSIGMVLLSLDWLGLTSNDLTAIAAVLDSGDLSGFRTVPDRGQQAMLNNILALRMMTRGMVNDPATAVNGHPTIDPTRVFYWGASLGGIYGATYMALTPDIERGVLGVPGQPFELLLPRSVHYDLFLVPIQNLYQDKARYPLFLAVAQTFWDRVDPTGYSAHVVSDPLPNGRTHQIFMIDAIGDHQVPTLGAHNLARTMGLSTVGPAQRAIFGLPNVPSPAPGSGFIEVDFGLPPEPITDVPARAGSDPHDGPWTLPVVIQMMVQFMKTGQVANLCAGPCSSM